MAADRIYGALPLYARLGVLPVSESLSEGQRMVAERGEEITFSQRRGPWHA